MLPLCSPAACAPSATAPATVTGVRVPLRLGLAFFALLAAGRPMLAQAQTRAGSDNHGQSTDSCRVERIRVLRLPQGREVRIETDCAPTFSTLHLAQPARLVIDLARGTVGNLAGRHPVGDGPISEVTLQQFGSAEIPVGRVQIALDEDVACEVVREGHAVVVRPTATDRRTALPQAALGSRAFVPTAAPPRATDFLAPAEEAEASAALGATPVAGASIGAGAATGVADAAAKVDGPARAARPLHLSALATHRNGAVLVLGQGETPAYRLTRLTQPPRLVVDIAGASARNQRLRLTRPPRWLRQVRLGRHEDALRIVFDLRGRAQPRVVAHPEGLWVGFGRPAAGAVGTTAEMALASVAPAGASSVASSASAAKTADATAGAGAGASAPATSFAGPAAPKAQLRGLQVEEVSAGNRRQTRIHLAVQGDPMAEVDARNNRAIILALAGTELPAELEQALGARKSSGLVSLVSAFQAQRRPAQVQVVASLTGKARQQLSRTADGYVWQFDETSSAGDAADAGVAAKVTPAAQTSRAFPRTAGFAADGSGVDSSDGDGDGDGDRDGAGEGDSHARRNPRSFGLRRPVGQQGRSLASLRSHRISLDVKDADIINVLRLISEETGENIIASDEVKGKITLKLRDVPAEQALDTVLRLKGFDRVRQHNILRIASADSIQKERDLEVQRKKALIEVEEVGIKMVTINYATASEVVEQLKPMLTGRGSLQVDGRTNTLIIQDVASNVDRLTELAHRLDKQTPLVNIQARIVEASSSFARDLGVQWGGATQHTARTGNPTGVYFPADVVASGAADMTLANQTAGVVSPSRYAVNFPATLDGKGAGLGFVLGSAGGAQLLDLRLSAMESNGTGKIISSPEVSTLDNKTARVSQGMEIPVSTVSAAGTMTRFVPAVLELEVTPHVTNDGTVLMKIHVQKSAADFTRKGGQGDPTINKRQAETEVLVRDGDTSVIGGILTRETTDTLSQVPFLARIPILGSLFRRHESGDTRAELLVFITPRIINREASTVQSGSVFDGTQN